MVTQPQSTTTKPAPLSYADRARNHTKNESSPTKPAVNGVSANTLPPASTSGASKPTTAIKVSPPNPKHPPAPSMRQPSTSNSSTQSTGTNSTLSVNGHPPTINGHPPTTSDTSTPPHPPVNIWNLRKEQMAQSQATQRPSVVPPAKDPPPSVASQHRDPSTGSGLREGAISSRPIHSTNGGSTVGSENDDPFVVKPRSSQPLNSIPPVEDKESWPEVGSSITTPTSNNGKEHGDKAAKPPQDSSKKAERRRWVQFPPEELQATADALQPRNHRPNPRNRPQSRNNDNSANASSGSGEVSQRSSRPHSVRTSASHSRVSSRTGSVHTSPRYPTNRSLYDTPEVPLPAPYPEAPHNSRYLHPNPSVDNSMNNPYAYSYSPIEGSSAGSSSQHYYSGSVGYENQLPHSTPHVSGPPHFHHVPHYQQPQHGSGHGYPHLSQPTPHRPSDSIINFTPSPPTQYSSESRIPLLTTLSRPPPPERSAAVNGYRDIGVALSANTLDQQLIFGRVRPQTAEGDTNTAVSSPELVVNITDEVTGNAPLEPRLPSFTIGVTQEDTTATVKGRKLGKAITTGDSASARGSGISGVVDRTNPEVAFQFGTLPPLDVTSGTTSGSTGASDQAGSVELESLRSDTGDEWQVRDFGYGFGHMSGSGNAAAVIREELNVREQQRFHERRQKEEQERERERESSESPQDRPRRASFNGGYERGGYSGRRGRGLNGGYGRGYGRGFSRGGYGQYPRQHQYSATPPGQFSQLPPHAAHGYSPDQSVYFLPPPPQPPSFGSYLPGGYEAYQYPSFPPPPALYPPVPQPVSQLPFALDHTRYYLLGQLEYYLSPQNMAQDFYLRQQMNPEGWISIPLLASFNRIRQLTPEPHLVREVLAMSSVAEVSGEWVRMGGNQWAPFVLPPPTPSGHQPTPETAIVQENVEEDGNVEEEDDDDVEFVISQDHENQSWTSERRPL